jgi:hypothetical protein
VEQINHLREPGEKMQKKYLNSNKTWVMEPPTSAPSTKKPHPVSKVGIFFYLPNLQSIVQKDISQQVRQILCCPLEFEMKKNRKCD